MFSSPSPPSRSPLTTPRQLAGMLEGPGQRPVVLDVRWRLGGPPGRADHDTAHIPGAVFLDLDVELAGPPGAAGRHPLPEPERLRSVLRAAGVDDGSTVVAHDDGNGSVAARAWWLLRWAGLPAGRVSVLDGGYAAWTAEGLPTTDEPSWPAPGGVTVPESGGAMAVLDADAAAATARRGVLLDARPAARYRGEVEPVDPRPGHIPGALSVPAVELVGPDGRWLPPSVLAVRLSGLGVGPVGEVGAYCGSGVTAAALVLAAEYAGVRPAERPVALYAGSWSSWSADPSRPAVLGSTP